MASHKRSDIFEDLGGNVYGNGTYVLLPDSQSHAMSAHYV